MSVESVIPSNHLILSHPFLLLPSIFLSIRVSSNESAVRIRWPKYWNFSISPSNDFSGLIFFRIDWLDLLAVHGTLKSLLQLHSSKASVLRRSVFLMVQLSHSYMTTGKTIALTMWTFVNKIMSLLFNTLVCYGSPSKEQASFNFMAVVTICSNFGAQENKVSHCFHCFPIYLP
uniref:RNA polymerase II subunit D n=1 Tax=Ovis aries TaxID=9940 RepID=A0AC11CXQ7_SHEEP